MKTSSTTVFLCTTALTGAFVIGGSLQGCRSDTNGSLGAGATAATNASNGSTGTGNSTSGTGGTVAAETVTIQQIVDPTAAGHVGPSTPVKIVGAVAMSIKFLVSKSSSNSCLWGVFLSAPGLTTTAANTGILAVSYGTPAVSNDGGTAYCPVIQANQPAGDAFPDDTKPGDVLDVVGETDSYIPKTCAAADAGPGASDVPGIQLSKVSSATKTGTATTPAPYVLTTSDLANLAGGTDATWLTQWGNVRVEADNVSVMAYMGTSLEDTYGHMYLTDGIQIGDKLYYVGYVKSQDACYSGPVYPTNTPTFSSIKGFVYLDFCNWGIVPSDKCHDLDPASEDCLSMDDAGVGDAGDGGDAGGPTPATTCLH